MFFFHDEDDDVEACSDVESGRKEERAGSIEMGEVSMIGSGEDPSTANPMQTQGAAEEANKKSRGTRYFQERLR